LSESAAQDGFHEMSQQLMGANNPRIVEDVDGDKNFTISELATESVQKYILSVINKDVYHNRWTLVHLHKGIQTFQTVQISTGADHLECQPL
jgi:hypothetical protein